MNHHHHYHRNRSIRFVWILFVIVLLCITWNNNNIVYVSGNMMITINDAGTQLTSTLSNNDQNDMKLLRNGRKYVAHLQSISNNVVMSLCRNHYNNNNNNDDVDSHNIQSSMIHTVIPNDHIPIALLIPDHLVNDNNCTIQEKIKYLYDYIFDEHQKSIIQYVIMIMNDNNIDNDDKILDNQYDYKDNEYDSNKNKVRKLKTKDITNYPYMIRISSNIGNKLIEQLNQQSYETYENHGGIEITMVRYDTNGNRLYGKQYTYEVALWIGISFIMLVISCILLLFTGNRYNDIPPSYIHLDPIRTDTNGQRRLTQEQVNQLFPIYIYNGKTLHIKSDNTITTKNNNNNNNIKNHSIIIHQNNNDMNHTTNNQIISEYIIRNPEYEAPSLCFPCENKDITTTNDNTNNQLNDSSFHNNNDNNNNIVNLIECSICLDEYSIDDEVRIIQQCSNHTFHSTCIERWFVERSATCPLCKHDIQMNHHHNNNNNEDATTTTNDNQDPTIPNSNRNNNNNSNNGINTVRISFHPGVTNNTTNNGRNTIMNWMMTTIGQRQQRRRHMNDHITLDDNMILLSNNNNNANTMTTTTNGLDVDNNIIDDIVDDMLISRYNTTPSALELSDTVSVTDQNITQSSSSSIVHIFRNFLFPSNNNNESSRMSRRSREINDANANLLMNHWNSSTNTVLDDTNILSEPLLSSTTTSVVEQQQHLEA